MKNAFEVALENGEVRKTPDNLVAIVDVIQKIENCTIKQAQDKLNYLKGKHLELHGFFQSYSFGVGKPTQVTDFEHAVQVIMLMSGKAAAKVRQDAARLLARYLQADITLALDIIDRSTAKFSWKHFAERIDLTKNNVPSGYFCVFVEAAPLILPLIENELPYNEKSIIDISIGQRWASHWKTGDFEGKYGKRIKYLHKYPDDYPQARSNPQDANAYPMHALGEFRLWLENEYLPNKLPVYLEGQVGTKKISKQLATSISDALVPKQIS